MAIRKYVLFVDTANGPLGALAPGLRELDYRIVCMPTAGRALEFLRAFPKLSMVVINGAVAAAEGAAFVASAKQLQPAVPIVWLSASDQNDAPVSGAVPDVVVVPPFDAQALEAASARLLREWFYPPPLVNELIGCANRALGAFGTYALAGDPFLKSSRTVVGGLTEMITFSGDRVAGKLIVSCTERYGRHLHSRVFPEDRQAEALHARDLLGEIANQTLGRFKEYFERHALGVLLGVPTTVRVGTNLLVVDDCDRPSLCIEFEDSLGRIFFEFCFGTFDPAIAEREVAVEFLKSNELILL